MPDDVLDMIGTAAALEQLAEESARTSTVTRWMPASITQERCPVSLWLPAGRLTARTSPRVLKSRKSPLRSCAA